MTGANTPLDNSRMTREVSITFEGNRHVELVNINDRFIRLLESKFHNPAIEMQRDEEKSQNQPTSSFGVRQVQIRVSVGAPKHFEGIDQARSEFTNLFDSYILELTDKNFAPVIRATPNPSLENSR